MSQTKKKKTAAPRNSAASLKRQREAIIRDKNAVDKMWSDPDLFYKVQQNYEAMLNLVAMLDIVVQDLSEDAPFLFRGNTQCYKRLLRSLDECMENLRTDPILYGRNNDNDAAYFDEIQTSYKLLAMVKGLLLRCNTEKGLLETDSIIKLHVVTPTLEKREKYRMAHETLRRHQWEFPAEYLERWRKYEEQNKDVS